MSSVTSLVVPSTTCSDADLDRAIARDLHRQLNAAQRSAVFAPVAASQFLVAGPGSGKTTVLALRVLRFVFVDGVEPDAIIATTFTRKAAAELRSRILGWGDTLKRSLVADGVIAPGTALDRVDLNAIWTGTLDSLSEEILGQFRLPGAQPPAVIEEFVARAQMLRRGLFPGRRDLRSEIVAYLAAIRGTSFGLNAPSIAGLVGNLRQRLIHDGVDRGAYRATGNACAVCGTHPHAGVAIACDAIDDYEQFLASAGVVDFAGLEERFLAALGRGDLAAFVDPLRHILVDEYQDTNWLQEQIYLHLATSCVAAGGSITVVGDDDQSLYRFRGATVDLFRDFSARGQTAIGHTPPPTWLVENYRSSEDVVDFCNAFIALDPGYQPARITGKPPIRHARAGAARLPILGLFRDNPAQLAHELAKLLDGVFNGSGYTLPGGQIIERDPAAGTIGDCAVLAHSVREYKSNGTTPRFPLLLRQELERLPSPLRVFNPRGRPLTDIDTVQILCGLMLECIDPGATCQTATRLSRGVAAAFTAWRATAQAFITNHPNPAARTALTTYMQAWAAAIAQGNARVPIAELVYDLVYWLEPMQGDIEGLVHLEVIQRTITESARFGSFGGAIVMDPRWHPSSVNSAFWDVFVPIADGAVDIDEDLLETLPTDRLNVMTVHQAKGLEFPFVIFDIGVDNATRRTPRNRFPTRGEDAHAMEDELRQFSVGLGPPTRTQVDRAFDDLTRLAFVAFSRAKDALLIVGHSATLTRVETVAAGWTRDGAHRWAGGFPNMLML